MGRKGLLIGSCVLVWSLSATAVQLGGAPAQAPVAASSPHATALRRYCVTCHNGRLRTAGLSLEDLDVANPAARPDAWEKVIQKLRSRTMPPAQSPRPDEATYDSLATWLEGSLDRAAAARPNPARPLLHRMNRAEYRNAVRDLLALDVDVSALPADDSTYGFDNIADALGTSPLLLESYVTMARKISRMAIGSPGIPPVTTTYTTPEDLTQDYHLRDLPLGTRGGLRVEQYFAVDAEYEIRVRLRRTATGSIRGIAEEHQLELMLDGQRIGLFPVGGKDAYRPVVANEQNPAQTASKAFTADEPMRVRMKIPAGRHTMVAAFVGKPPVLSEQLNKPFLRSYVSANPQTGLPDVDRLLITGPFESGAADRHAQPRANLQLPSRDTRRGEPLRPLDPVAARPPRLSPAPRRIRARSAARVLRRREAAQRLRRRHRARAAVHAEQPAVHLPARIRACRSGARRGLRAVGSGRRVAALVLPVEQHSG